MSVYLPAKSQVVNFTATKCKHACDALKNIFGMDEADGTPKKFIGPSAKCFICSNSAVAREKIYIFGRSLVDLNRLVNLAVVINLSNNCA